jgi:hexulose-6-phosphate isomerase
MNGKRFKKGYSLVIRDRRTMEEYLPSIAEAGFDGIEPTFLEGAYPSPEEHTGRAAELRDICDRIGLKIFGMRAGSVPWTTIPSLDASERRRALDHTRKACESLAVLGGDVLLVVPGRRDPAVDYRTHWNRVTEYARAAGDIAVGFDVSIGLENVEARFPASEMEWASLIDEIAHPRVGMYLDAGNVLWLGFGFPEQWIRTLGQRIFRVHFKDAVYRLNGAALQSEIRQILDGEVNWPAVMSALDDIGYQGWVSVEPENCRYLPHRLPSRLSADLSAILETPRS